MDRTTPSRHPDPERPAGRARRGASGPTSMAVARPLPVTGFVLIDGQGGRVRVPVTVLYETPRQYRIRLEGEAYRLRKGAEASVGKDAVRFDPEGDA